MSARAEIAIVGGSGLYAMPGLEQVEEVRVDTPFGAPSDSIQLATLHGRRLAFLARHGRRHTLLPHEINYRANIYALKLLGVHSILSASAVGSMKEDIHPRDLVFPDQFIDRTQGREGTFFGDGVAAHVSMADPVCPALRRALCAAAEAAGARTHDGGTYVCIQGPAFSTRAESEVYRNYGVDVIGMTNIPEARLAREAEIRYATMALVTDYDCWHEEEGDVTVDSVLENLKANSEMAIRVLSAVVEGFPTEFDCDSADALATALITPVEAIGEEPRRRLKAILGRYLDR
ncbi:S-methyl-5'-thioadenosine phosphorylase [Acidobacteria bacterium Mor1]|nr:S-methyl-5'-thioadenosine phosphorylase [Acidobacteria bacterium Mor1]